MSKGAYTYEPGNITEFGKDRMRFELGDTMVEGLADDRRGDTSSNRRIPE